MFRFDVILLEIQYYGCLCCVGKVAKVVLHFYTTQYEFKMKTEQSERKKRLFVHSHVFMSEEEVKKCVTTYVVHRMFACLFMSVFSFFFFFIGVSFCFVDEFDMFVFGGWTRQQNKRQQQNECSKCQWYASWRGMGRGEETRVENRDKKWYEIPIKLFDKCIYHSTIVDDHDDGDKWHLWFGKEFVPSFVSNSFHLLSISIWTRFTISFFLPFHVFLYLVVFVFRCPFTLTRRDRCVCCGCGGGSGCITISLCGSPATQFTFVKSVNKLLLNT